jgi:uncharacterized lipoprotein
MKSVVKIISLFGILALGACSSSPKSQLVQSDESQNLEVQSIPEIVKFDGKEQESLKKSENTFDVSKVAPKGHKTQKSQIPQKS